MRRTVRPLAIAALACPLAVDAQASATAAHLDRPSTVVVTGRVVDVVTRAPLAGVPIYADGDRIVATTGKDGSFRIRGLPVGSQRLNAWASGYASYYRYVTIPSVKPCAKRGATKAGARRKWCGSYTVTTKFSLQKATPRSVDVVAQAPAPRSRPVGRTEGSNVADMPLIPEVAAPQVRIRGVNSANAGMVMIDGVRVDPSQFDALNPNDIESIEVLRGPAAVSTYGNEAENGVIIVKKKKR